MVFSKRFITDKPLVLPLSKEARNVLVPFYPNIEDTLMTSALHGHSGQAAVMPDGLSCMLFGHDFAFPGGRPNTALLEWLDEARGCGMCIIGGSGEWLDAVYSYPVPCEKSVRFAIGFPKSFPTDTLRRYSNTLPEGSSLSLINESLFTQCMSEEWSRDLCSCFADWPDFLEHGIGIVALMNDRIVAGASTFAWDGDSVEVEIDTHPDFRRRGFACACGAGMILECIKRNIRPHWDAANETSARLAVRLGYPSPVPYPVAVWNAYNER